MTYDLFVDESCHLEHDKIPVMCLGYTKVPELAYEKLKQELKQLRIANNMRAEIRWKKFSNSRLPFYKALVDFFFANPIEFRCVLVKYKDRLTHEDYNRGSSGNFYYKTTYQLLKPNPSNANYRVFLDIQDTKGKEKLGKIKEEFDKHLQDSLPFIHFQYLRSSDNAFFQLTDFFIGAITYRARQINGNIGHHKGKDDFINYLEAKSGFVLHEGNAPWETKFNISDLQPKNR